MLISSLKTLLAVSFITAWIFSISEFTFIKCVTEFENFYASRFISYEVQGAKEAISYQTQRWIEQENIDQSLSARQNNVQQPYKKYHVEDNKLIHIRKTPISKLILPFVPKQIRTEVDGTSFINVSAVSNLRKEHQ